MRQDRFLIGILTGIGALVVLALAVYFLRRGGLDYVPEDTPQGVVQNYIVALQRRDYERAYRYLGNIPNRPDLAGFRNAFLSYLDREVALTGIEIGEVSLSASGSSARVYLTILRGGRGPFDQGFRENYTAELAQEDGQWKLQNMPYPFWSYDWVQPLPAEPVKPSP